jgi:hypothetical protein
MVCCCYPEGQDKNTGLPLCIYDSVRLPRLSESANHAFGPSKERASKQPDINAATLEGICIYPERLNKLGLMSIAISGYPDMQSISQYCRPDYTILQILPAVQSALTRQKKGGLSGFRVDDFRIRPRNVRSIANSTVAGDFDTAKQIHHPIRDPQKEVDPTSGIPFDQDKYLARTAKPVAPISIRSGQMNQSNTETSENADVQPGRGTNAHPISLAARSTQETVDPKPATRSWSAEIQNESPQPLQVETRNPLLCFQEQGK